MAPEESKTKPEEITALNREKLLEESKKRHDEARKKLLAPHEEPEATPAISEKNNPQD